jgi:hypothetical protein
MESSPWLSGPKINPLLPRYILVFPKQPGADNHRESPHTTHYPIYTRFTSAKHSSLTDIYFVCFTPLRFRLLGYFGLSVIRTFAIYCPYLHPLFMKLRLGFWYSGHFILMKPISELAETKNWHYTTFLGSMKRIDSLWATIQSPVLFYPKHRLSRSSSATHLAQRLTSSAWPHQENNIASHSHKSVLQVEFRHWKPWWDTAFTALLYF